MAPRFEELAIYPVPDRSALHLLCRWNLPSDHIMALQVFWVPKVQSAVVRGNSVPLPFRGLPDCV